MGRGSLAFSGCLGQCAAAHKCHAMECPREIRAVRRALLLPSGGGAEGPQGAGSAGAQHPAAWRASLLFGSEEDGFRARQRGLQLFHRGFQELKGGSEASDDVQADNVSNEGVVCH